MVIPKIKECLPLANGLWAHIDYQFPEEFDITASQLDTVFLSNWSQRLSAPILRFIHNDDGTYMLNNAELTTLADIINGMYKHRWDKLMDVALAEYDPIHNYYDSLTEEIDYQESALGSKTGSGTHSNTRTDNLSKSITDTRTETQTLNTTDNTTDTRSETQTINTTDTTTDTRQILETRNLTETGTNSVDNEIYGFNSATAVGDTESSGSTSNLDTGTVTTAHSGNLAEVKGGTITTAHSGGTNETKGGTITNAHSGGTSESNTGTQTNAGTDSTSESSQDSKGGERTRSYTKTGNIGNISTQKLLGEELELWKYNFVYEIMRDVINFISLPVYETDTY